MPRALHEQVVVVTGASSGIGRETARQFAYRGARLVIAARNRTALESLAREIRKDGGRVIVVPTDMADPDAVEELVAQTHEAYGRIDTWINAAGVGLYSSFERAAIAELRRVVEVDFWSVAYAYKYALPEIRAGGGGTVMTVVSAFAEAGMPLQAAYAAATQAIIGLTASIRQELAHDRVPVALVLIKAPAIDTPLFLHARTRLGVAPRPLGPLYDPALVGRTIVRLAEHPRPEVVIGGATQAYRWLRRLAPGLLERESRARTYAGQQSEIPKAEDAPSNLFAPMDEPVAVRHTGKGWRTSWVMWLEAHPAAAFAGLALAGAALAAAVRPRR